MEKIVLCEIRSQFPLVLFLLHSNSTEIPLKSIRANFTFLSRSENLIRQRLTFCLILDKKKLEKDLARPGIEPATLQSEGDRANHYTMAS